ncbi:MAG: YqaA family protein [Gammaproteobacteria bacterium]|nr:YqaA family protein [Gammaproteobacteria bacterium]
MDLSLWGLFGSAFISSTLFPGGSEALLLLLLSNGYSASSLLLVATLGNTLGGVSSWLLGHWISRGYGTRQLSDSQQRACQRLQKHGAPLLLLSWLPLVGDPLCLAAGWLRIPFFSSLLAILLGKAARYAVLLWLFG